MEKAKIIINKTEVTLGFIGISLVLILGKTFLTTTMLFFRLLVGIGLGYTLTRAYTGFAGSVNRAYNTGSTKLMRNLMFMFFISAVLTGALLFSVLRVFIIGIGHMSPRQSTFSYI